MELSNGPLYIDIRRMEVKEGEKIKSKAEIKILNANSDPISTFAAEKIKLAGFNDKNKPMKVDGGNVSFNIVEDGSVYRVKVKIEEFAKNESYLKTLHEDSLLSSHFSQ